MKKVPVELLPKLLEGAKEQKAGDCFATLSKKPNIAMVDNSYKKGHDLPEGFYMVKLLNIKCHGPYAYKMDLEVYGAIGDKEFPEPKTIKGYGERFDNSFEDLSACFGGGGHKKSTGYIGSYGVVYLTHSGWIKLMTRNEFDYLFPPF